MEKLWFASDYMEGAHPRLMARLNETNLERSAGYGLDPYCESARDRIRAACRCPEADVRFLVGGTQTNATVIDALLRPGQAALAADTGHINTHEAGAIEASGHKIAALPHTNGKITAAQVEALCRECPPDSECAHTVIPGLVYLSQPTEYGTLYTLAELGALSETCRKNGLYLYVDGARLAYALCSPENDVSLADLARLTDAFYLGGTKCGALMGEAVVLPNPRLIPRFFTIIKLHGALLAKGRLLGVQFEAMLRQNEYTALCGRANELAQRVKQAFEEYGCPMLADTRTNQIFPIVPNRVLKKLSETVCFSSWQPMDETHTAVRFCTSATTRAEEVEALLEQLRLCF